MGLGARDVAPTLPGLDEFLLGTKLSIPDVRPGSVSRADLIKSARAGGCRLVTVSAPAGYGKTTLLAQWAAVEDRRVGWVSLDRLDDDPATLLMLLSAAFARGQPEGDGLVKDVRGLGGSPLGRAAPRLAAALRASTAGFVLMIDDLHELKAPGCYDVLSVVISGIPTGSQVVLSGRSEQPGLPRLRALGEVAEIGAADLALDADGAAQVFAASDLTISPEAAAELTERTEGWPTGLYLASLIARDDGRAEMVSGGDPYVADYLYRESLSRLPESTQRFLRRTAVLEHVCAPLGDALLGGSVSQELLRDLEASNSFLIPLDRRREWFRYHSLFREFLLGELRRVEPGVIEDLHLKAADWYAANQSPALAVEHLLNTGERARCARLVASIVLPTYSAGQISTVQRWLAALGDSTIEDYPPLAVLAGWIAALAGHPAVAQRWAAVVADTSFDQVPVDGTASFDSARAMLRAILCADGPDQMLADANAAVAGEPPWSRWRDTALVLAAEAHLLAGDVRGACELFTETTTVAEELGNTDTIVDSQAQLALVAIEDGRWSEAAEHVRHALAVIDEYRLDDYALSTLAFAAAARVAVHRSDGEETDRQLTRAMRARPAATAAMPTVAVRARLHLAKADAARGDLTTAHHLLGEIDAILLRRPALGCLVDDLLELREDLAARSVRGVAGTPPLTPAELRLLPYLQTHLTIGEIGERLFISRNTVSTEVASIYRKLGVSSRNAAVQRATAIGLIGDH